MVSNNTKPTHNDSKPILYTMLYNHLTSRVNQIKVSIHYVHEQYLLLTIYPFKLNITIQPDDTRNKISTDNII